MKTEAVVLSQFGQAEKAFQLKQVVIDSPKDNEIQIEVEAFGLNFADVMAREGKYRETPPLPAILGYEAVGKIVAIGQNVADEWLGKRVLAFTKFGAYAKHVNTLLTACIPVENEPAEQLLSLVTAGVTAWYMTEKLARISKGDSVLIHAAAGGVGLHLIQLCKQKGAIVIAKIGNDKKKDVCLKYGADYCINYRKSEYENELNNWLNGEKLKVSFNAVGGSTFKKDMKLLKPTGQLILFGGAEMAGGKKRILPTIQFLWKMGLVLPIGLMMQSKSIIGLNMLRVAENEPDIMNEGLSFLYNQMKQQKLILIPAQLHSLDQLSHLHNEFGNGHTQGKLAIRW